MPTAANTIFHTAMLSHHFTIVFGIHNPDKDAYIAHVRSKVALQAPIHFTCRYAMLGNDDSNDNYYVFLAPDEGYSAISLLPDRLYSGLLAPFLQLNIPYIPHLGIATIADAQKVKRLCDDLNATELNIVGTLNHITICAYDGTCITDLEQINFSAHP